jgi:two-component system sensor histidine kinase MprB
MSFRRRIVLLAAGAVAAAVVIVSVAVYLLTSHELSSQLDASLKQKITPGAAAAVKVQRILSLSGKHSAAGRREGNVTFTVTAGGGQQVLEDAPSTKRIYEATQSASASGLVRGFSAGSGSSRAIHLATLPSGASAVLPTPPVPGNVRLVLPRNALGQVAGYAQFVLAGKPVLRSEDVGKGLPVSAATLAVADGRHGPFFSEAEIGRTRVRTYTAAAPGGGVWQVALPVGDLTSTLSRLRLVLGLVSLGGVLLAAALGLLVSRAALVPVRRLTGAARRVARTTDLGHRIDRPGNDELGELAASFNTMLAALERSRQAQRALISDASHELRTPLTSVRANLDALAMDQLDERDRARAIASARAQLAELTVLVGDLVDLSKTGLDAVELEDVRLDLAVAATVARARLLACTAPGGAPEREIVLDAEPCLVRAAPARLDRAVSNLLDNACKWSPPGQPVEVSVRGGSVRVRDHGPGFADEDLPHVFDRFYRARAARALPGSGLGLAIVRQVAELHEGSAKAANGNGGGAELTLSLPLAEPVFVSAAVAPPTAADGVDATERTPQVAPADHAGRLAVQELPRAL